MNFKGPEPQGICDIRSFSIAWHARSARAADAKGALFYGLFCIVSIHIADQVQTAGVVHPRCEVHDEDGDRGTEANLLFDSSVHRGVDARGVPFGRIPEHVAGHLARLVEPDAAMAECPPFARE